MHILLTGATGYIGKRLLPVLLEQGHKVTCAVRDRRRMEEYLDRVETFEVDFLEEVDLEEAPLDFDVAYYLIHSMSSGIGDFEEMEARTAENFVRYIDASEAQQTVYLSGIVNEEKNLSTHLQSRRRVEDILCDGEVPCTVLRAGIIVGSGSASFEIIRDLVEKLPVMVAPRWLDTRCQPVAIRNVVQCLTGVLLRDECPGQSFDMGGPEVLTYKDMLHRYAEVRGLKRWIFTVPVMTPRLSSYWLYFITSTSYNLAVNLVDSMKVDVVAEDNRIFEILELQPMPYKEAVENAFDRIEQNVVISSWKDALISSTPTNDLFQHMRVPSYGCFKDRKQERLKGHSVERVLDNIWAIGGKRGWYYGNLLWKLRGYLDKLVGGVGLRRGRTNEDSIRPGDALDFWRVLVANREERRLLLYAEMKLPGEAWLEFHIREEEGEPVLQQTATFRPEGVFGRIYWYCVLPFHFFIFGGMIRNVVKYGEG